MAAERSWTLPRFRVSAMPAWLVSAIVHLLLLLMLALATFQPDLGSMAIVAILDRTDDPSDIRLDTLEPLKITPGDLADSSPLKDASDEPPDVELSRVDVFAATDRSQAKPPPIDFTQSVVPDMATLNSRVDAIRVTAFQGRGAGRRRELLEKGGGTPASEAAVALALQWLAAHQRPDGGWNFDHTRGPGRRTSPNPGTMTAAYNGATAIALLPFLGAGQTHQTGNYQETVAKGLDFLIKRQRRDGGFWEREAEMYSHGLAAICICEAYAMTQDPKFQEPAQDALDYIIRAQDRLGGGWRYKPGQAGDTSVLGWQLMALKSGAMAGLDVPTTTFAGASRFLDSVAMDGGITYGYEEPGRGDAVTAVGLLSRMYLGWTKEKPELGQGVILLSEAGPSDFNIYYNYYATQVIHHWGGELWDDWNNKLRPQLVASQIREGPAAGTWYFEDDHGTIPGGRLYCTAMATMILEVYYRHMPIYRERATDEEEFPLVDMERAKAKALLRLRQSRPAELEDKPASESQPTSNLPPASEPTSNDETSNDETSNDKNLAPPTATNPTRQKQEGQQEAAGEDSTSR